MLKTLRRIFIFMSFGFLLLLVFLAFKVYQSTKYQNPQDVTVKIQKGSSVRKIASQLEQEKIIQNRRAFEFYVRVLGKAGSLKAGEYEFEKDLSFTGIIEKMISGKVKLYKLTIPEGFSTRDICRILVEKTLFSFDECLAQTLRVEWLKEKDGITSLEGYLYPETYLYDSETRGEDLLKQMLEMFYQKIGEPRLKTLNEKGLDLHEWVILASVIEKETSLPSERSLIAAVIRNRLKIGMPLQMDSTVIYGMENFDGNLKKTDLETDTPYNTYTRLGLPAGPICSVSLESLDAALNPADSQALYFVAKGDGSHYFSDSLEKHNQAVQYYQLKIGTVPE